MNADMIPDMMYAYGHRFKFKMRCLKGIILESGKLIHPVEGLQVGYNKAAQTRIYSRLCDTFFDDPC